MLFRCFAVCISQEDCNAAFVNLQMQMREELERHTRHRHIVEERVQRAEGTVAQLAQQLDLVARDGKLLYRSLRDIIGGTMDGAATTRIL